MATVLLKPSAQHRLRNFYPWVRRDEVEAVQGSPENGEVVAVRDARGEFIGQAFFNAQSHITLRMVSLDARPINAAFLTERIRAAARRRSGRIAGTNAWRVVNGESDGLPGLIVDRLGDVLVVQFRNAGVERLRDALVEALIGEQGPRSIYERSDVEARGEEGLEPRAGPLWGDPPDTVEVEEQGVRFRVSLTQGQKTGFYLDQRDNRRRLREMARPGDRVLDMYCYVGAFALQAAAAGASALAVDKDAGALALLEQAAQSNGLSERVGVRWGDALEVMTALNGEGRKFTHVVLDPPTLVKRKEDLPRTKRLFVTLSAGAMRLLEPGGVLFLSSCAHYIGADDLLDTARIAGGDAQRRVEVLDVTYQPPDHPWIVQIPETLYLKTVILRVE